MNEPHYEQLYKHLLERHQETLKSNETLSATVLAFQLKINEMQRKHDEEMARLKANQIPKEP